MNTRPFLISRLKEEWNNLDPVDPLRGLIADAIDALAEQPAQQPAQQPICGLDVYLDPNDGLKPKLFPKKPAQPSKPLTDDPLQGAVDWLLQADGEYFCTATVQRTLRIGYNRAKRLCDTAKERAAHGIKGDA